MSPPGREREKRALWCFFVRGPEGGALAIECVPLRRGMRSAESAEGRWWALGLAGTIASVFPLSAQEMASRVLPRPCNKPARQERLPSLQTTKASAHRGGASYPVTRLRRGPVIQALVQSGLSLSCLEDSTTQGLTCMLWIVCGQSRWSGFPPLVDFLMEAA